MSTKATKTSEATAPKRRKKTPAKAEPAAEAAAKPEDQVDESPEEQEAAATEGTGAEEAEAILDDGSDGDDDDDVINEVIGHLDVAMGDVANVLENMRETSEMAKEAGDDDAEDMSNVYERVRADVSDMLGGFSEDTGVGAQGLDLTSREALLIDGSGTTKKGANVVVEHNKANTAIRLRIGKKRIPEAQAFHTLQQLVNADQVKLSELTVAFVPSGDDEGSELAFSASDHDSCAALLNQVRPLPLAWVMRDVEMMCGEVQSSLKIASDLMEANLRLISGGVRCTLPGKGERIAGLQRWVFKDGVIYSLSWLDGGEKAASERLRRISLVELLKEMYEYRSEGWVDFKLLANLDAMTTIREDAHTIDGKYREKTKAVPHDVDTTIIYESAIEDGDYGTVQHIAKLWNLIRDHLTAAFDEHIQSPLETLSGIKDVIDKSIFESVEQVQGLVKSELVTRTLEQFEEAEPEPTEDEDEDDGTDEPDFGEDEEEEDGPMALGSEKTQSALARLRRELSEGKDDEDDEEEAPAPSKVGKNVRGNRARGAAVRKRGRARGGVAGETKRSRF